jgi:hypothetical protein
MNGDEGGVGYEVAIWGKKGTRKVEAFLDVGADGGLLERAAHGLCHAHEAVGEEGEENGVGAFGGRHGGWGRAVAERT